MQNDQEEKINKLLEKLKEINNDLTQLIGIGDDIGDLSVNLMKLLK